MAHVLSATWCDGPTKSNTGLDLAFAQGNKQVISTVLKHIPLDTAAIQLLATVFPYVCSLRDVQLLASLTDSVPVECQIEILQAQTQQNQSTALAFACRSGSVHVLQFLVQRLEQHGLLWDTILKQDSEGQSVLHYCARYGHTECIPVLLSRLSEDAKQQLVLLTDRLGHTSLHIMCQNNQPACITTLLSSLADTLAHDLVLKDWKQSNTALHMCCELGHQLCVTALMEPLPDSTRQTLALCQDCEGRSALHNASEEGHIACVDALLSQLDVDFVEKLITLKDNDERTAISYASENKNYKTIASLISPKYHYSKVNHYQHDQFANSCNHYSKFIYSIQPKKWRENFPPFKLH